MPSIQVKTNVKVKNHDDFMKSLTELSVKILNKPLSYINVVLTDEASLYFNGTNDPTYVVKIYSLGNLNAESNKQISKELSTFLENELGVPNNRGYIFFIDPGRENCGYLGGTFA